MPTDERLSSRAVAAPIFACVPMYCSYLVMLARDDTVPGQRHPMPARSYRSVHAGDACSASIGNRSHTQRLPAIHRQHLPGDPARLRRCQKQRRIGNVLHLPESTEWDAVADACIQVRFFVAAACP